MTVILAGLFGSVIGLALGLLGAGGSILAVPALVYGVGQPLHTAIPTSLAVVAVSSLAAVSPRARRAHVRWPVALVFGAAGIPAAFVGTALSRFLPQRWLLLAFAALMVGVAVGMLRKNANRRGACRTGEDGVDWRSCLPKSIGAGAAVGILTGLFGVGGGFVIVPALGALLGLEAQAAVATSLVIVLINALAGLAAHAGATASLDYGVLGVFACAAMVISVFAGRLAPRLDSDTLRRWFAHVVLAVAAGVALAGVLNPTALG